jgi:hypothetical protein
MATAQHGSSTSVDDRVLGALDDLVSAVEAGAGLPEVARAASRALNAGLAIIDPTSHVLAVACASPEDERAVLGAAEGTETVTLRVAENHVGDMRLLPRGLRPAPAVSRTVTALLALEADRARSPARASDAAVESFLGDVLERSLTDREHIVARARELGTDLADGAAVVLARAHPQQPEEGDWRGRAMAVAERGARAVARDALCAATRVERGSHAGDNGERGDLLVVLPGSDPDVGRRGAAAVRRELETTLLGYSLTVARSRPVSDPVDLHRAAGEALLAANVAEARGQVELAFEETGAYRLLLSAVTDDSDELRSFHEETVAPLLAYDDQYETELLRTLETYLDADGSVASTAQTLFTHRHTIRYRLERVRELTGLDVSSSDGRERLSLGLKAMRVLGIGRPAGPATEPGTEGGRVRREEPDR